jgi:peptidoglycan/LPS O-acetylase OafA/YrhL
LGELLMSRDAESQAAAFIVLLIVGFLVAAPILAIFSQDAGMTSLIAACFVAVLFGGKSSDRKGTGAAPDHTVWRGVGEGLVAGLAMVGFAVLAYCVYLRLNNGI